MNREEKLRQLAELLEELYPTAHIDLQKSCGAFDDEPIMDFVSIYVNAYDPESGDKIGDAIISFPYDKDFEPYSHVYLD